MKALILSTVMFLVIGGTGGFLSYRAIHEARLGERVALSELDQCYARENTAKANATKVAETLKRTEERATTAEAAASTAISRAIQAEEAAAPPQCRDPEHPIPCTDFNQKWCCGADYVCDTKNANKCLPYPSTNPATESVPDRTPSRGESYEERKNRCWSLYWSCSAQCEGLSKKGFFDPYHSCKGNCGAARNSCMGS